MSTELASDRSADDDSVVERAFRSAITPRRERTRERLLDAAYQDFAQHGVHGASIEAICDAAGFTRGAFYSNFESKEELFIVLADRQVRSRLAALEHAVTALDADTGKRDLLDRDAVQSVLAAVVSDPGDERHWYLMTTEFELLALRDPDVGVRWVAQQRALRGELEEALPRLLGRLGLRFRVEPATAVDLLLTAYEAGVRETFLTGAADAAAPARGSEMLEVLVDLLVADAT